MRSGGGRATAVHHQVRQPGPRQDTDKQEAGKQLRPVPHR